MSFGASWACESGWASEVGRPASPPAFAGLRTAYLGAVDNANTSTGWHALAALNVP